MTIKPTFVNRIIFGYRKKNWYFIFIILFLILNACQNNLSSKQLKALPQDNLIQVYFNQNQAKGAEYLEPYRKIKRSGDNLEQIIIDQINSAQFSIDLAVQELNLPNISQALLSRYQQGIKIRVIIENTYNVSTNNFDEDIALDILKNNQIPLIDDTEDGSKGSGLMHNKFMIIDNKKVITGSANYTYSGIHGDLDNLETRGNANHILVINDEKLANIFTEQFNQMWGDGMGGKKDSLFGLKKSYHSPQTLTIGDNTIQIKFSPTSPSKPFSETTNGLIVDNLEKSSQSVDLALFVFSDQNIANTLEKNHDQGVEIRALIDKNFAFQYYSEGLDLLGVELLKKCKSEQNNHPWTNPIQTVGTSNLPIGDKLHHKFGIIDQSTIITGSHNWSESANSRNDETLLVIQNPIVAQHFTREFERLYDDSTLGIPVYLEEKITENKNKCSR